MPSVIALVFVTFWGVSALVITIFFLYILLMSKFELREFQKEAIASAISAWKRGRTSILISAPTGAGKTVIFASLLMQIANDPRQRCLVLVHRDSLLQQTIETMSYVWPQAIIGQIQGKRKDFGHRVTVASIPTLNVCLQEFIAQTKLYGDIGYVVVDECHHSLADSWAGIVNTFKNTGKAKILGVTATPIRTNKNESLSDIFEEIVYSISIFQLIQDDLLASIVGQNVHLRDLRLEKARTMRGDYITSDLSALVNTVEFRRIIIEEWKSKAAKRKTICFAVDVNHIDNLVKDFNAAGARAIGIHGKIDRQKQRSILRRFATSEYNVLVNCMLLTEGYDNKAIDAVFLCRPTRSKTLYIQMVGRGLRLSQETGKTDCLVIDFTPSSSNAGMITMQDMLAFYGLKNAGSVSSPQITINKLNIASIQRADEILAEVTSSTLNCMPAEETHVSNVSDKEICYSSVSFFNLDKFVWVKFDGHSFLKARKDLTVAVIKEDNLYSPYLLFTPEKYRKAKVKLADKIELHFAMKIANVYLYDYGDRSVLSASSEWRNRENTAEQATALASAISVHKNKYPNSDLDLESIPKQKGAYSDHLNSLYSYADIVDNNTCSTTTSAAGEQLKHMLLRSREEKRRDYGPQYPRVMVSRFLTAKLHLRGKRTDEDIHNVREILIGLSNDKYADFLTNFIEKNTIVFNENSVTIKQTAYPPYPIKEKQKSLLLDRINAVLRLYYRDKKLIIQAHVGTLDLPGRRK